MKSHDATTPYRNPILGLALFNALSAIGGGVAFILAPANSDVVPASLLVGSPFDTFMIPGLLLAVVVGGTSVISALLAWRRSIFAVDGALLAGGAATVWMAVEIALLPGLHWLQVTYGAIGLAILILGISGAVRTGIRRHRWMVSVTLGEAVGLLFPLLAGILTTSAGLDPGRQAIVLVAAGYFEGMFLGAGQALAFGAPIRRLRYAVLTAVGASLVWANVMSMMVLVGSEANPGLVAIAGIAATIVALTAIGALQWLEIRPHSKRSARHWIGWTALAWVLALPASFAPGLLVDETTPLWDNAVIWASGGLVMAYVMALVTWQGYRRVVGDLQPRSSNQAQT